MYPPYLVVDAVDLCVVFGALKSGSILFYREYALPTACEGECDDISTNTSEGVHESCLLGRRRLRHMERNLAVLGRTSAFGDTLWIKTHFATGSGVTPNHASSVNQIPSSYLEKML